jgi:hypothetical protein
MSLSKLSQVQIALQLIERYCYFVIEHGSDNQAQFAKDLLQQLKTTGTVSSNQASTIIGLKTALQDKHQQKDKSKKKPRDTSNNGPREVGQRAPLQKVPANIVNDLYNYIIEKGNDQERFFAGNVLKFFNTYKGLTDKQLSSLMNAKIKIDARIEREKNPKPKKVKHDPFSSLVEKLKQNQPIELPEQKQSLNLDEFKDLLRKIQEEKQDKVGGVNMNLIKKLIRTADFLDQQGHHQLADEADQLINELAEKQDYDFSNLTDEDFQFVDPSEDDVELTDFADIVGDEQVDSQPQSVELQDFPMPDSEPEIEEIKEPEPEYDRVTIQDLKDMIDNASRYPIAFRKNKELLERAVENAEKAIKYFEAYKRFLNETHSTLDSGELKMRLKDFQ